MVQCTPVTHQTTPCCLYKKGDNEPNDALNNTSINLLHLHWFWASHVGAMEIRCCSRLLRFRWCNTFWMCAFFFLKSFSVKELVTPSHNYFYHLKIVDILQNYSHSSFAWWSKPHIKILIWAVCLNLVCHQGRTKDWSWCHRLLWRWACHFLWLCVSDNWWLCFWRGHVAGRSAPGSRSMG